MPTISGRPVAPRDPEQEQKAWRTFQEHRIDGVLYVTMYHRLADVVPVPLGIPTILVNCRPTVPGTMPSVTTDDYAGGRRLAEFVLAQGHGRLAYVRLNPVLIGGEERLRAFRDVVAASGIPDDRASEHLGMAGPVGHEENFVYDEVTERNSRCRSRDRR